MLVCRALSTVVFPLILCLCLFFSSPFRLRLQPPSSPLIRPLVYHVLIISLKEVSKNLMSTDKMFFSASYFPYA